MTKLLTFAKYLGFSIYAMCGVLLVVFLVPATGWKALSVQTGSMNPAIAPGSLVIIHRTAAADLGVRDVATYVNPANQSQTITHRIVAVKSEEPRTFVFKGDANPSPDPNDIVAGRVVGKVVLGIPGLGNLMNGLRHPAGVAAVVIIPGLLVIGAELRTLGRLLYGQPQGSQSRGVSGQGRGATSKSRGPDRKPGEPSDPPSGTTAPKTGTSPASSVEPSRASSTEISTIASNDVPNTTTSSAPSTAPGVVVTTPIEPLPPEPRIKTVPASLRHQVKMEAETKAKANAKGKSKNTSVSPDPASADPSRSLDGMHRQA